MILAVDVGNSNTTVGLFNGTGELLFRALLETSRSKTRDQCAIELLGVFQLYGADACTVDGAILSSVVPPLTTIFTDAIARLTGIPPMVVGPGIRTGLNIKAEIHNQLGSDIVASSVAAIAKYPSPIVMVDMGTATSLSLIVGSVYEGCIIMPGLALALDALSERAAALPPISIETASPVGLMGHTTEEAMRSGVLYGHASMVDGMLERIEESIGQSVTTVATGGNAPRILRYCKRPIQYDADLIMTGLYLLYQKNAKSTGKRDRPRHFCTQRLSAVGK